MRFRLSRGILLAATLLAAIPHAAMALDLASALREVASANPTLASRRDMAEAARRRVAPAGAWSPPMVELGAINVPTNGRFDMDPMTMKMVGIRQRIPVFGANRLSRGSASAAARAEDAGLETEGAEMLAMAWEAYADAYYAGRLAALSRTHRSDMERLVGSARARYESGNGRLDDVLRAEAERARSLSDEASWTAEEQSARARLAALMGRDGAVLTDSLVEPPALSLPADPGALIAQVNETHPRLRELGAEADRYRLAARASRRMAWPDLEVGVSYGFREPIMGVAQDDMWSATLDFMLPIFAGQREWSEGAGMDAMARSAEADRKAATLELDQRIRSLYAGVASGRRTIALLADTVVVTERRAVEASMSAYVAGTTDLWRVFEAEHALYEEEVALVRARQDLARTEAQLVAATARGDLLGVSLPGFERSGR